MAKDQRRPDKLHLSTHQQIAHQVARTRGIFPDKERTILLRYLKALKKGAIYPDTHLKDFSNHYVEVENGKVTRVSAILNILKMVEMLISKKLRSKPFAFQMGILSHYISDLGQPLHTASYPEEKRIHSEMETQIKEHLWILPFRYTHLQIQSQNDMFEQIISYCTKANLPYKYLIDQYNRGNGLPACLDTIKQAYNDSCNMVANIWLYVIKEVKEDE